MYIVVKYQNLLVLASKQKEKFIRGSLFFHFLKLIQINFIFAYNVHILSIYNMAN